MDIKALAEKHEAYIIERRRFYHTCPELSGEERETRAKIRKDLEAIGITDIREMKDCFGLIADIKGKAQPHSGKPGGIVALRADIDALPINEETELPFTSQNAGCMHACGHDCHISMLLGAGKILNDVKDELCGTVRLLFQPAEETAAGAPKMIKEGALDGVDAIYGGHIWGTFQAPLFDCSAGNRMASCDKFTITVKGTAAHASAPHLGVDAITVAAAIVSNLQQCVSRMNDPLNPLVLTIGTIKGGSRWNVIPNSVTMEGTIRTFEAGFEKRDMMKRIISDTAAAFGAEGELEYQRLTPPVINSDEKLNRIAHDAAVKVCGEKGLGYQPTMMGSEDFSWYGQPADGGFAGVPYIYCFLGSRNEAKGITYTNHHEKYTVDEDALKVGAGVMAQFAADFLADK